MQDISNSSILRIRVYHTYLPETTQINTVWTFTNRTNTVVGTQKYNSGPSVYNALVEDHASAHSVNMDEYRSTQEQTDKQT